MEKIPPKERFNQHAASTAVAPEILREALKKFGVKAANWDLKQLSGGFMNANFLASGEGRRLVLRVYSSPMPVAQKEFDLLRFLESHEVKTPQAFALYEIQGRPVMVMEFLNGITLENRLQSGEVLDSTVYEKIGRVLGEIHKIRFPRAGFFGPGLSVGEGYDNFTAFIGEFVDRTLRDLESRPEKLPLEMNARYRRLFEDKWELAVRSEAFPVLAHCDFNPKNILVSRSGVSPDVVGVIDWEFSDAGNGLMDVGNFFRFEYDYASDARERFVEGYCSSGATLDPEWEACARLLDLGAMCGFLERREDYQKSFRTARAVIQDTLEHFGY